MIVLSPISAKPTVISPTPKPIVVSELSQTPVATKTSTGHATPRYIVRQAARSVEVEKNFSPLWMRHAHASHTLDCGAAVHLVQATLSHSSVATTGRYLHARSTESGSKYLAP